MKTVWTFEGTKRKSYSKEGAERAAQGARVYSIEYEEPESASMRELKELLRGVPIEALESACAAVRPKSWN